MKNKIEEAVIIVGGLGTRLLPYTKSVTKEMMPIFDVPAIFLLVKEAYLSGIKKIIFVVTKRNKKLIKSFFTDDPYLNNFIKDEKDKMALLKEVNFITKNLTFKYVYQTERGSYGSVYSARNYLENDNFIVMYGDDLMDSEIPLTKQLIEEYKKNPTMLIAIKELPFQELPKSGVIQLNNNRYLTGIVKRENANNAIALGRFLLNKKIFKIKKQLPYYKNQELYLPHALLNFQGEVKAYYFKDYYFNIGEKLGFIEASIHYALKSKDYQKEMLKYLKKLDLNNY